MRARARATQKAGDDRFGGELNSHCFRDNGCLAPIRDIGRGEAPRAGSTKKRSLAIDMANAIFVHPLLAESRNTLFAMFDG
jgi:hypothetical protein